VKVTFCTVIGTKSHEEQIPDWHGTTGRDDLVGGGDATQFSTTIEGVTLCSVEPFTDDEIAALREYFALEDGNEDCGHPNHGNSDHDCRPFLPPNPGVCDQPA